jgi:hypothetical protein
MWEAPRDAQIEIENADGSAEKLSGREDDTETDRFGGILLLLSLGVAKMVGKEGDVGKEARSIDDFKDKHVRRLQGGNGRTTMQIDEFFALL